MQTTLTYLTDDNSEEIMSHMSEDFMLVFTAKWCGPCKSFKSMTLEPLAADLEDGVAVLVVDVDDAPNLTAKHDVRGVPTTEFYSADGKMIRTIKGALSRSQVKEHFLDAA